MPGRTYTASAGYRFGFNGKEIDNELYGNGNAQNYGMREYDPRLVRLNFSVDPLYKKYPELSTYQFASNSPIKNIDLDGLEGVIYSITRDLSTKIKKVDKTVLSKPGPLGSGAAVILDKDGVKSYMYGESSKDINDFVSHYEGRETKVYSSLEGGNPTGGVGHKLSDEEMKQYPVGTVLNDKTIDSWFSTDWDNKTKLVEGNESTKDLTGGKKEALTDFSFNGLKVSDFSKGDDETFLLGYLRGEAGTVKKRIGELILFKDDKKYNLDIVNDKKTQQSIKDQVNK